MEEREEEVEEQDEAEDMDIGLGSLADKFGMDKIMIQLGQILF